MEIRKILLPIRKILLLIWGAFMRFIRKLLTWRALFYFILIIFAVFFLLPIWGALTTSLKTPTEVDTSNPIFFPSHITLSPYSQAFNYLKSPLLNSIFITIGGTAGSVFLGSICGFVFCKYRFKYDTFIFMLLVAGIFLPYQAILVPLYQTIGGLGLYATIPGLILIHTAFGIPMCAFLFRSFYGAIPDSIIKQAKVDGAGPWRTYWKIVLPSTVLATATVIIFQFTSIWNEFLFGLVFGGARAMPATVALNNLTGTMAAEWNVLMAGSLLVSLPVLVLFMVLGKCLVRGYMAGAISGS